ncbi:MAG: DUF2231 domain-containing protein, partial [Sulfurovum sp.]|nr:DUF2231 domain-containing protein [Sulfurovum sp.]
VALFSQFTYMVTKDKAYSKAATRIIAFALLVSVFAVLSGLSDAEKIMNANTILEDGVNVLNNHKIFGFVVVAILFVTTVTKWFALSKNSSRLEYLSIALIIIVFMTTLYQGRSGGSLVYQYAGGIDNQVITQRVNEQKKN